jgi:hypothetical protein
MSVYVEPRFFSKKNDDFNEEFNEKTREIRLRFLRDIKEEIRSGLQRIYFQNDEMKKEIEDLKNNIIKKEKENSKIKESVVVKQEKKKDNENTSWWWS